MSQIESPLRVRNTDSYEQKLQREADRRVAAANYILVKLGRYNFGTAPPGSPYEIDNILERLDK